MRGNGKRKFNNVDKIFLKNQKENQGKVNQFPPVRYSRGRST